jgi:hypothetical protein
MALTYTTNIQDTPGGGAKIVTGKWTVTDATAGGEIATGLNTILYAHPTVYGAAGQTAAAFNETFPFSAGTITLATTSGYTGGYVAIGF